MGMITVNEFVLDTLLKSYCDSILCHYCPLSELCNNVDPYAEDPADDCKNFIREILTNPAIDRPSKLWYNTNRDKERN